jgi:hypothetical protein
MKIINQLLEGDLKVIFKEKLYGATEKHGKCRETLPRITLQPRG